MVADTTENAVLCFLYINSVLEIFSVKFSNIKFICSDAAKYNEKLRKKLISENSNLVYTFCFIHMLHNCSLSVKNYFTNVNSLIASVKATTCNTKKQNFL